MQSNKYHFVRHGLRLYQIKVDSWGRLKLWLRGIDCITVAVICFSQVNLMTVNRINPLPAEIQLRLRFSHVTERRALWRLPHFFPVILRIKCFWPDLMWTTSKCTLYVSQWTFKVPPDGTCMDIRFQCPPRLFNLEIFELLWLEKSSSLAVTPK